MEEITKKNKKTKSKRNGEGTIYYSEAKKKWIGQYTAGIKNGKLHRPTISGKSYSEVSSRLKKILHDLDSKTYLDKNKINLRQLIPLCIEDEFTANIISESTYVRKSETANIIYKMNIANIPIQELNENEINCALNDIKHYSESQIEKIYEIIHQAYNKAVLLKVLNNDTNLFNTKGAIKKPKSTQKTDFNNEIITSKEEEKALSLDEQKLLLDEIKSKDYLYKDPMLISLFTGMRIGEVLALRVKNIDLENKTIHIRNTLTKDKKGNIILGYTTKTYSGSRDIPIPDNIQKILESNIFCDIQIQKNNYLNNYDDSVISFTSRLPSKKTNDLLFLYNGKPINPVTINSHLKRICKNAGIRIINTKKKKKNNNIEKMVNLKSSNVNTHMLRHTYATRCIEAGMPAVVLQKLLGHKDVTITLNTYTHVFNKFKQNELDKVNNYLKKLNII